MSIPIPAIFIVFNSRIVENHDDKLHLRRILDYFALRKTNAKHCINSNPAISLSRYPPLVRFEEPLHPKSLNNEENHCL